MRRIALLALLACAATPLSAQLALTHANVVDVERGVVLTNRTVLISGNRITAVGAGVRVPAGARVRDARGKYVIPGLWDMHVHTSREGRALHFWPLFLAHGVTGVREMGSYLDTLQHWRAVARRPGSGAPRIVWSSPMLDGVPTSWVHGYGVPDAAGARAAVDTMRRLGFDFLKVYDRLPRDTYLALAAEAKRRGIPFAGHVPQAVTAVEASDAGQRSIEHVTNALHVACTPRGAELLDTYLKARESLGAEADSTRAALGRLRSAADAGPVEDACRPTFTRLAANGTWLTPTLAVTHGQVPPDALVADPRLRFVPPALAARWRSDHASADPDEIRFGRRMEANAWRLVGMARRAGVGRRGVRLRRVRGARRARPPGRRRALAAGCAPGRHAEPGPLPGRHGLARHRRAGQAGRPRHPGRQSPGRHPQHHPHPRRRRERPPDRCGRARPPPRPRRRRGRPRRHRSARAPLAHTETQRHREDLLSLCLCVSM